VLFKVNQKVYVHALKAYGHVQNIVSGGYQVTIAENNLLPLSTQTIFFRQEQITDGNI